MAEHIVRRLAQKNHWSQLALSAEAVGAWASNRGRANVRELQNVLARAAILSRGRMILPDDLVASPGATEDKKQQESPESSLSLKEILAETERRVILQALEQTGWSRTRAAQLLDISRRQLYDKIQQYNLRRDPPAGAPPV